MPTPKASVVDTSADALRNMVEMKGMLRIITNEHDCGGGLHPSSPNFNQAKCSAYQFGENDPRHFVMHDVVRVEGPDPHGAYMAYSAEGDYTVGKSGPLLARLTEWQRVSS